MLSQVENKITTKVTLILDESEARALDALVGYGDDAFFEQFYKLGRHYMEPHEKGLRSFFKAVREQVLPNINVLDRARRFLVNESQDSTKPKDFNFNLNYDILFKVNQEGYTHFAEVFKKNNSNVPASDGKGYYQMQAYEFMKLFGHMFYMGNPNNPFDMNVIFKRH